MSDVERYIERRKAKDPAFAEGFEARYRELGIGVLLRQAREDAGLTQEELARKTSISKAAISRLEIRAGDVRLSTLQRVAEALGRELHVVLR